MILIGFFWNSLEFLQFNQESLEVSFSLSRLHCTVTGVNITVHLADFHQQIVDCFFNKHNDCFSLFEVEDETLA